MFIFCKINSGAISGLRAYPVCVEADICNGLPSFSMVGLLSSEVREAKERVKTAIRNSGIMIPPKRIMINLSPADIKKEGSCFDLPIAIAILVSLGMVSRQIVEQSMFLGELSLDGTINRVNGVLSITILAKELGLSRIFVPKENGIEGAIINGIEVVGVATLDETITIMNNIELIKPEFVKQYNIEETFYNIDFSEICGQDAAKRATEIAVAGMHNILFIGAPGTGKSMIANRIPTILPKLQYDEMVEITKIYSALGMLQSQPFIDKHPFRAPHHTITPQALVGGGRNPKPGEITLAHKGVLFLDELPEFSRKAIETLRQPMEDHKIMINRENATFEYPADFMVVAAMNPCVCGYYPDKSLCNCTSYDVNKYTNKVKGAFLDRIDICVQTSRVDVHLLQKNGNFESSKEIRKRIENARKMQEERFQNTGICFNSRLTPSTLQKYCKLGYGELKLLSNTFIKLELSTRVYHKIIKVARTIADLDGEKEINKEHLLEAIAYRNVLVNY